MNEDQAGWGGGGRVGAEGDGAKAGVATITVTTTAIMRTVTVEQGRLFVLLVIKTIYLKASRSIRTRYATGGRTFRSNRRIVCSLCFG